MNHNSERKYKIMNMSLVVGMLMIVVGYFLWTILIPIQDMEMIPFEELRELQKELAINYSLGRWMMVAGSVGVLTVVVFYISILIKYVIDYINKGVFIKG